MKIIINEQCNEQHADQDVPVEGGKIKGQSDCVISSKAVKTVQNQHILLINKIKTDFAPDVMGGSLS